MILDRPHEDILPLFCDLFPFGKGLIVMLKVYLDRAYKADANDDIMCIAAVIYKPNKYKRFVKQWNPMLKAWRASAFHATDFYNGWEEFKRNTKEREYLFDSDSKRIPRMVGRFLERVLIVSFRPDEFNELTTPKSREQFGASLHSQAVQLALVRNGYWREDCYPKESFSYFMEQGDLDQGEIVKTIALLKNTKDYGIKQLLSIHSFTVVDKGGARGLEAADFVGWHWNKHYMDKVRTGHEETRRKDFTAFIKTPKENAIEYIFLTGRKLKTYIALGQRMLSEK